MYGEWLVLLLLLWPVSTPIPSSLWLHFRLGFQIFTRLEPFLNLRLWSHTVKTAACIKHFIIICRIVEIPAEAAVLGSLAFYNGPSKDGTRPGQFLVNTYQHDTRYKLKSLLQHQICCIFPLLYYTLKFFPSYYFNSCDCITYIHCDFIAYSVSKIQTVCNRELSDSLNELCSDKGKSHINQVIHCIQLIVGQ